MSDKPFATGRCLCGKVSYSIVSEPLRMAQCHCDYCQRSSGTGHMSIAFFLKDDVTIDGETSSYTTDADSGDEVTRHFCTDCGSRLFGTNNSLTKIMGIPVGCIDDNSWFKPGAIVYNKRKPVWDFMDESLPTFEAMPPPPKK
ncbi:MAG: GFA family protein [Thiotrichaceae bacterium]|nr:GFA family protein [Thiotrichaceae bacterium]